MDGDTVYVELLPEESSNEEEASISKPPAAASSSAALSDETEKLDLSEIDEDEDDDQDDEVGGTFQYLIPIVGIPSTDN
jgi:hypothetical protein